MLVIPGSTAKTCDGITRRELLRVGGSAMLGLSPGRRPADCEAQAEATRPGRRPRLRQGQERHPALPAGRPEPSRPLGSQGQRSRQRPQRLQAHRHQDARRAVHRTAAEARPGHRQGDADPLDELHAGRPVQSHRRHLPDADRLHGRQGQPVGPARAAQPEGLPQRRLEHHPSQAAGRADAAVRHDAAAACRRATSSARAARPASSAGRTIRISCTRPATTWTWPRWTASRSTTCSCGPRSSSAAARTPGQAARRHQRRACRSWKRRRPSTTSTSTTARR